MEYQMSIFEMIGIDEKKNIENMTTEELAKEIGQIIGVNFVPSGWRDEYEARITKKLVLSIHKSRYACDTMMNKEGDAFIGCGFSYNNNEGGGSPIDTIDGAIKYFKHAIAKYSVI